MRYEPMNRVFTPKSWIKGYLKEKLYEKWARQWATSGEDNYAHTKLWIPKIGIPQTKGLLEINNRKTVGLIAQWVTSFNNLNYHTHRKHKKDFPNTDKTCRLCKNPKSLETSWHLATECERTANAARLHLHKFTLDHKSWTWDSLKAFITSPMIFKLVTTRAEVGGDDDGDQT